MKSLSVKIYKLIEDEESEKKIKCEEIGTTTTTRNVEYTRIIADKVHYFIQPSLSLVITPSAKFNSVKTEIVFFSGALAQKKKSYSMRKMKHFYEHVMSQLFESEREKIGSIYKKFEVDLHQNIALN